MILKTRLLGTTYAFRDVKDALAKANEDKTGDRLAGLAAETAQGSCQSGSSQSSPVRSSGAPGGPL